MGNDLFQMNMRSTLKNNILESKGYIIVDIHFLSTQGEEFDVINCTNILKEEMKKQVPADILEKYNLIKILN